jgi:hypothetical protein
LYSAIPRSAACYQKSGQSASCRKSQFQSWLAQSGFQFAKVICELQLVVFKFLGHNANFLTMRVSVGAVLFASPDIGRLTFSLCQFTQSFSICSQLTVIGFGSENRQGSESPHPGSALRNLNGIGGFCQEMNKRVLSQSNSALNSVAMRLG